MSKQTFSTLFVLYALFFLSILTVNSQIYGNSVQDNAKAFVTDSLDPLFLEDLLVVEKKKNFSSDAIQKMNEVTISQGNFLQLSDALKTFSGTFIKDYGGVGGLKTVSVRSLGANHTGVIYDGVGVSDINTGQIDLSRFSVDNLETISLSQGQPDVALQPARSIASASVIMLQTKRPVFSSAGKSNGYLSLKTGSFGLYNPSVTLNQKYSERWVATFQIDWLTSEGNYPYTMIYGSSENDSSSVEYRKNTGFSQLRTESNLFGTLKDGSRIQIKFYFQSVDRALPGATVFYASQDYARQKLLEKTVFTQGHFRKEFTDRFNMLLNWKYSLGKMTYLDPDFLNSAGYMEQNYVQDEAYLSAAFSYELSRNFRFSYSSDIFTNSMRAENSDNPLRISALNYLAANFHSRNFNISCGLLQSLISENSDKSLNENHELFTHHSPYASLEYRPLQQLTLRAFQKNIFRMPTFSDMYYPLMGNPDLLPENAMLTNFGLTYLIKAGKADIELIADIYSNLVTNKIVAFPNKSVYSWTILNFGKTVSKGADLGLNLKYKWGENSSLNFSNNYSYQRALDITDPEGQSYMHQLPYTPRVSGSSSLGWTSKDWYVQTSLVWSGHRYVLPQNFSANRLPGYSDVQMSYGKSFRLNDYSMDFKAEVLNLFGQNYSVIRWFPMPGRNYRITLKLNF